MDQSKALAILKSGRNVFLTGSAGTGKTYVLNQFTKHLKDAKVAVAITASTGIAATHINGVTIHSWSGIGVKQDIDSKGLKRLSFRKDLVKKITKAKVLIIDEISMLHKCQLDLVDKVTRHFKDPFLPFGGLQIVLCGDFFQLPPIGNSLEKSKDKFSFMSEAWKNGDFNICYLTKQYRQNDDTLHLILNQIRKGKIEGEAINHLKNANKNSLNNNITPTKLYTHNIDVDTINQKHLEELEGKKRFFKATTTGEKALVEILKNSVIAKNELQLKIGAKVMFLKNNPEQGYINGTLGEVIDYSEVGLPVVKTTNNKKITVSPEKWSIDDENGKSVASFNQIPLRLAWAITIHKSQGMTLDFVEMDLTKTFEKGQGYVALSRLKKIENLQLKGFNTMSLQIDSLAHKADIRFQELSEILNVNTTYPDLEIEQKKFIKSVGGRNLTKIDNA